LICNIYPEKLQYEVLRTRTLFLFCPSQASIPK
jgi:hypothetical protein